LLVEVGRYVKARRRERFGEDRIGKKICHWYTPYRGIASWLLRCAVRSTDRTTTRYVVERRTSVLGQLPLAEISCVACPGTRNQTRKFSDFPSP
jgi:hypothetical protein